MKSVKHNIYNKMNMALYRHRLKPYYEILKSIKSFQMNDWSDSKIKGFAQELKHKSQTGVPLKNLLTEAAALVGEAVWRSLRIRLYETQLVAGLALHGVEPQRTERANREAVGRFALCVLSQAYCAPPPASGAARR